jgi:hypothetical protein
LYSVNKLSFVGRVTNRTFSKHGGGQTTRVEKVQGVYTSMYIYGMVCTYRT